MSEMSEGKNTGRIIHRTPVAMDNPEVVDKNYDWWDVLCKAHGEKNLWPKKYKYKAKAKQKKQKKGAK
jgi:hypothetical protein